MELTCGTITTSGMLFSYQLLSPSPSPLPSSLHSFTCLLRPCESPYKYLPSNTHHPPSIHPPPHPLFETLFQTPSPHPLPHDSVHPSAPDAIMISKSPAHLTPPRHSSNGFKRNATNAADARLSIIAEDGVLSPHPAKAHNRPFSRRWNIGDPPRHSFEKSPPSYSVWDVTGPKGEKLGDVRNNKHIASRGGWKRTCLIALLVLAMLVALIVGLIVGLQKKHKKGYELEFVIVRAQLMIVSSAPSNSPSSNSSSPNSPSRTGPFPAGAYTFTTYLETVTTNCTSAPADWQCNPYHTYSESPSGAQTLYQWIITDSGSPSSPELSISSSGDFLSVQFSNATLTLVDKDSSAERYTFKTTFNKIVIPQNGIYCYFNNTILEGTLYTKRAKSVPGKTSPSSTSSAAQPTATGEATSNTFGEWKYAVQAVQSIGGGSTTPECFRMNNGVRGAKLSDGITPQASENMCSCVYKNYDL